MKAISVIGRKAGLDAAAFRTYYEERHVPLALRFYRFAAYRRSYVLALEGDLPPFAVMPEFWSVDEMGNRAVATSPNGEIIRQDEQRFMGEPRLAATSSETIIAPGPLTDHRLAIFARAEGDVLTLLHRLAEWGARTVPGNTRVTLDETTPLTGAGFVADAVLSLWIGDIPVPKPPAGINIVGVGRFAVVETPTERLAARAGEIV